MSAFAELRLAVRGEQTGYAIAIPMNAHPAVQYAAEELRDFTERVAGVRLPVVSSQWSDSGQLLPAKAIVLCDSGSACSARLRHPDAFRLHVEGNRLFIVGGSPSGVLYGVYELLERFAGCRWYASWHTVVPKRDIFAVPGDLDDMQTPAFDMRCVAFYDALRNNDFAARLRMNAKGWPWMPRFEERHGGNPFRFGGRDMGHSFFLYLPPSEYFDEHPEYFSEVAGKRVRNGQLCLTNPQVATIVATNLLAAIRKNPDARIWSISQMDTDKYCTCPSCTAVDDEEGSRAGTVIRFVNAVAEVVEKEFPDVLVHTFAYQHTRRPCKTSPRRNVLVMLCDIECDFARPLDESPYPENKTVCETVREWKRLSGRLMVWDYVTDFLYYAMPFGNVYALQGNARFFRDNGVKYLFEQGAYQGRHADFAELKTWLLAKWMWNPDLPIEALLDDFFSGYYGKAAPFVRQYFDELHRLQLNYSADPKHPLRFCSPIANPALTDDFLERAAGYWAQAINAVKDNARTSYNVRMGAFPVDFLRFMRIDRAYDFTCDSAAEPRIDKAKELAKSLLSRMAEAKDIRLAESNGRNGPAVSNLKAIVAGLRPRRFDGMGEIEDADIECKEHLGRKVDDAAACDGRALMLPGTHHEWSGRFRMSKVFFETDRKYRLRVRVRVDKVGEGEAFWAGVYNERTKRDRATILPKTADCGDGYAWYDILTWAPDDDDIFWIGPPRFNKDGKSAVNAVYIDKIELSLVDGEVHDDPARWVDPFVGTEATGHTTPAACVPFGLVQAGPDTVGRETMWWHYCSGYRHDDDGICGFSQSHLNGTGGIDLGDVLILPMAEAKLKVEKLKVGFDKSSEMAKPGYYAVKLDGGIDVEIAATEHAAIYRFKYEKRGAAHLLVDLLQGLSLRQHDNGKDVKCTAVFDGKSGLSGTIKRTGWVSRDVSFSLAFDSPYSSVQTMPPQRPGETAPRYVFDFDHMAGDTLTVKIGLSAEGGAEAAKRNLASEIPDWDFEAVKSAARAKWNDVLGRAQIEGSDEQKKNWYTSLYHLFIQPNNIADCGDKPFYSTFSLWDTFRAAHPLYTILAPERAAEFVDSMLEQGKRTGYLPIWTLWGKDNQCMIGTHSVPVIVDWFLKEVGENSSSSRKEEQIPLSNSNSTLQLHSPTPTQYSNSYWLSAYAQIKDTLTKPHEGRIKERWDLLDKYGYYPFDIIKGESVSRTMECAYDDWCAGVMAQKLGEWGTAAAKAMAVESGNGERDESLKADAEFFLKRSGNWRNVFDSSIGLVRGKDSKGDWREPFDPYRLGHGSSRDNDFTEGNAFQYTWHVMQDLQGFVAAMGGREAFVKKLDSLFLAPSRTDGMGEVLDVTGLIGQYVHGNEPSHHVIYFYPQVGHPEKAAERIREVFDKFYLPKPDGLCGNDDCGQMSAWYLFSAMGFYPFNPCGGEYILGAPQVACAKLKVKNGEFKVVARNFSRENKYVKSVTLNGKPIVDWKIRHADIMAGGELVFEMGAKK